MAEINITLVYIIAIAATMFLMALGAVIVQIVLNHKYRKALIRQSQHRLHTTIPIDQSIPELLEYIIFECFSEYQAMTLVPLNEEFINDEREKEIRNDLVKLVGERISPVALEKITVFYNEDNIATIIANKIYITVMDYVVKHNSPYYQDLDSATKK